MRKKLLIMIGIILFILGLFEVDYLIYKKKNIETVLKTETKENPNDEKNFAIMLEQTDGSYKNIPRMSFYQPGYTFNSEKSGCVDVNGNKINNALNYNDSTKAIIANVKGTVRCYVYFDGIVPSNESISINYNLAYAPSITVSLALNAKNASEMCISNTTSCTNWEKYATKKTWVLEIGDGIKTVYVTYRNESGKTSETISDTVIFDPTAPSLTVENPASSLSSSPTIVTNASYTVSGTVSDVTSGIRSLTVNGNGFPINGNNWSTTITLPMETTTTVRIIAIDKVGNSVEITRYVYFDKINLYEACGSNTMTQCKNNDNLKTVYDIWQSGLEGDGYRYYGTNPDNYICFGTTDKDACKENTDAYMYRIIGVFADSSGNQHMKLIKKEALNTGMKWDDDNVTDTDWGESSLFKAINGSIYLTNPAYMPTGWNNRITNWIWSAVNTLTDEKSGPDYFNITTSQVYLHELNRNSKSSSVGEWTTPQAQIGLMYLSDYQMSLGSKGLNYVGSRVGVFQPGWMDLSNNDDDAPSFWSWTISRYGLNYEFNNHLAWSETDAKWVGNLFSVCPVFYLNSDQEIKSGSGTLSDPFILK